MSFQRAGEGGKYGRHYYIFNKISVLANEFGWRYRAHDTQTGLISFKHEDPDDNQNADRLDIWVTKMTIGYLAADTDRHVYMYRVPFEELADIFDDPDRWSRSGNYKKN